ncbi:lipopolysaccharide biosynthesis protein [Clostridium perfringens]|uniref:lipopolysaccharide biosynthesis protein n=3 Tax=Clostridium perfringens TaxID=1502 RepID=UPI0008A6CC77|nr:oligosaccharide flippase family protein [Clostridium perfringens]AOY52892.1 Polysaccharide biosynthesis protein [Clostridium perfringens]MDK0680091.1 oligosaccharide flippase family protein [Clostridium perfringens]MDK0781477.1 oligosaccharide flippase family protein [Clostridium perfringens]MDK0858281.1 oligosaccharide flippase family protein [Clostridium perfringens]MDM0559249.1 oligosaccharide flippase family protein [Clostridium perfringens]
MYLKKKLNSMNNIVKNSIVRNIILLLKGNILASLIGLFNTMILVNSIGLENNGIIFMAQSYVMLFNTLFNFQSYSAIIMFVPRAFKEGNQKIVVYLKQGFILDFATAFLAIIIASIFLYPTSKFMNWNSTVINCTYIYICIILFKTTGTMAGILRIYDNFKESVYINISEVLFKFIFFSIGYILREDIYYFIVIEVISALISMIGYIYFSYRVVKRENLHFRGEKWALDKEFFKFNLYSNLEMAVDLPLVHITPFIINYVLGFSDIAVYKIIEKLGTLISRVTIPITQAIYPNLSIKIANNDINGVKKIHSKIKFMILILGIFIIILCGLTLNIWLHYFIPLTTINGVTFLMYLVYIVFTNMYMAIHPIFTFLGYIKKNIVIISISNVIYIIFLYLLSINFGVLGIVLAKIIQSIIVIICKEVVLKINCYKKINI